MLFITDILSKVIFVLKCKNTKIKLFLYFLLKKINYFFIFVFLQIYKMNTTTITNKQTINIKFITKLIGLLLLLGTLVYSGTTYFNQFAHKKKQKTEQKNSNRTKSNSKNDRNWQNKKKSGKNEPHKNQNVKKTIEKQLEKVNKEIKRLAEKINKTKADRKELKKLRGKRENIIKKISQKGETHWRK